MPDPLVAGNWKMHGSRASIARLLDDLVEHLGSCETEVVVCPPVVFLADVASSLEGSRIKVGAQNISEFDEGAYTGEVSGSMLREFDCRYVIVGHSERRQWYHESDAQVADKFVAAQKVGLKPILCVGETLAEREQNLTLAVVRRQLDAVADKVGGKALATAAIAYEPIWAIGTGVVATPDEVQQVLAEIRIKLGGAGARTQLLYGGSVTAKNAEQLFAQKDVNGALVGGASLDAEHFVKICKMAGLG